MQIIKDLLVSAGPYIPGMAISDSAEFGIGFPSNNRPAENRVLDPDE